jgi:DNA-binding NtrC family response regulator
VRIIAATNKDLEAMVKAKTFREDLYYRLNVVRITLPPLRARRADIALLARHFLAELATEHNRQAPELTREAMEVLQAYHWPGNIRELRNVMENTFVFLRSGTITPAELPDSVKGSTLPQETIQFPLGIPLEEVETKYLKAMLQLADGNRTRASEILGISRRTLQRQDQRARPRSRISGPLGPFHPGTARLRTRCLKNRTPTQPPLYSLRPPRVATPTSDRQAPSWRWKAGGAPAPLQAWPVARRRDRWHA